MGERSLKLCLIGAGRMGGALLTRWAATEGLIDAAALQIVEPRPSAALKDQFGDRLLADAAALDPAGAPDLAILAVKPDKAGEAARAVRAIYPGVPLLSIAAGVDLRTLESAGGAGPAIRSMPNTPAQVGEGVTALIGTAAVTGGLRDNVERLMTAAGAAVWLTDEAQMDAVTAISGSGPAYVFLMTECLAAAAQSLGLSGELSETLARRTIIGAGAVLAARDDAPGDLRREVTSPGGTTEAALNELVADGGLGALLRRAAMAARKRAAELGR